MIKILDQKQQPMNDEEETLELTRIGCKRLILQPTNSRPCHLILLYNKLHNDGWEVENERIEKLSSGWYITTSFRKQILDGITNDVNEDKMDDTMVLPGAILSTTMSDSHPMYQTFEEYCHHHSVWIEEDSKAGRNVDPQEANWLNVFRKPSLQ